MGRGLSELQKTILKMAYKNHVDEELTLPEYRVVVYENFPLPPFTSEDVAGGRVSAEEGFRAWNEAEEKALEILRKRVPDLLPDPASWGSSESIIGAARALAGTFYSYQEAHAFSCSLMQRGFEEGFVVINRFIPEGNFDLYFHEVLLECFGFNEHLKTDYTGNLVSIRFPENACLPGQRNAVGQFFSRESIGAARYNAATASAARAFRRLEERALVLRIVGTQWHWQIQGIKLTAAGCETAKDLSVNTLVVNASINR